MAETMSLFEGTNPLKLDKPVRLIELFAGIGSQAKALKRLGVEFEHYRICEYDKYAVCAYNAIHKTDFTTSDIRQIRAEDLGVTETDKYLYILTYSFPCTDISRAGQRKGIGRESGTRSGLLWEVERLLNEMSELPQILLMENVPDVLRRKFRSDFFEWCGFLEGKGYANKYSVLNAKDYTVPQNRARCFMVSWLGDHCYGFPEPAPLERRLKDVLEDEVDRKYYLSEERMKKVEWALKKAGGDIRVAGSMDPDRIQDNRTRIIGDQGISPTVNASDYKGPVKIAAGIHLGQSEGFARSPLPGLSRTLKANKADAGVIEYGENN